MRSQRTDAYCARLAIRLAADACALPGGLEKPGLAQSVANLTTEGDVGEEALSAVANAIFEAVHQTTPDPSPSMQLASLIRCEHIPVPGCAWGARKAPHPHGPGREPLVGEP